MDPKYPIYIISKGRWESRLTVKALEEINVPYKIVIEPQELNKYNKVIDKNNILVLPFSNLGQGSIPARNWVWEHSIKNKAKKHWILDDNIQCFYRRNYNLTIKVSSGTIFRCAEDFSDRYENVALSGFNYFMFSPSWMDQPPYYLNTRIYSCILINNIIPYRWRGKYNEDTDLSLCALKDKWCTILFNAFLCAKATTMTMIGGNTDQLYKEDGRLKMAKELQKNHPDVTKIIWRWGRWQHYVNYTAFEKNKLKLKKEVNIQNKINNYGMILKNISTNKIINLQEKNIFNAR